ncbi:hypothetical protein OMP43_14270 [Sphingomonas sp. CBMAI 2297]|uniref:hypothetical protein n=1 Tax=Sphingomonas sp. CBMAI 2297 TaxID=2991720 RepID=UPI002453FA2B|nr:hypothetical protein [Sphingomonas sp. CBMAI 2297]MDH4745182.1 hypothetical protein [Sphingomonas sp. CBMAI 2297]
MAIGMVLAAWFAQDLALVTADAADPVAVATKLDITSFPNSTGPRRKEGLRTFADYGFTSVARDGNAAVLDAADKSWTFRVSILDRGDKAMKLCILDRALNGGSYFSVKPIEVTQGKDGLFRATGNPVADPNCA